jgi:eukaryotic-like serine/threonine-protein kinase
MTHAPSPNTQRLDAPAALLSAHPVLALLAPRYEILREIGSGGMGYVFQARDRETGDVLAIKILRPEIAREAAMAERFKNELRLARRITHKNVCRIYDFNRIDSLAYITMEYVDGETLRAAIDRTGALPVARVAALLRDIGTGLSEAHAQGVIHRDLKPENIMIAGSGSVKIMDFGIARSMEAGATTTQTLIGTPAYMSPEQVQGRGVDARSDIYALGLILYECLTGRRAFAAPTPVAVAIKQVQERPTALHSIRADVPRVLEAAVMRCLEKEPARRFASIAELLHTFTRAGPQAMAAAPTPRRLLWWIVPVVAVAVVGAVLTKRHNSANPSSPSAPAASAPAVSPANARAAPVAPEPRATVENKEATVPAPAEKTQEPRISIERLQHEAESGNAQAQLRLARLLANGPAALRDEPKAREWLERSAQQGNAEAQFMLGWMYENGRGGDRDPRTALAWYQRAAQAGHEGAEKNLARLKERGRIRRAQ